MDREIAAAIFVDDGWVSVKDRLPDLIPVGNPPHEFVACSTEVLVCGWVDGELLHSIADLRRGGRGLEDRAVHWNVHRDDFWRRDHLVSHWKPLTKPAY